MQYTDQEINLTHGDLLVADRWYYFWNRRKMKLCFRFRCGPVPYIHRPTSHRGCYFQSIPHIAAFRDYYKAIEDGIPLRQKRVELPDPYRDRKRKRPKDWKSYRKTQYK